MAKVALVFPGQGSQYVGMGRELAQNYPRAAAIFDEADAALGLEIRKMCFTGPEEELKPTYNTQPALLTVSVACYAVLEEMGVKADLVAGHSLGEYSALVAAKALEFKDAVQLVRRRGLYMEEAVPDGRGSMAAVLGLAPEKVPEALHKASSVGVVEAVNYNCPGQIVLAGETEALKAAGEQALALGAKRVLPLAVSGPFHSSLMSPAAEKLRAELEKVAIKDPQIPVVTNAFAQEARTAAEVREALAVQVDHPVLWEQSVELMANQGVTTFIEVGPGKVLSGLIKKISRGAEVYNVEDQKSLDQVLASLRRGV